LNVFDAPLASDDVQVNVHVFEVVVADEPLPLRGLSFAPEGTLSLVQCAPLATLKVTAKPLRAEAPVFLIVMVPQ
jgi:hypothetical protein